MEVARLERTMERLAERERALQEEMVVAATDHVRLRELQVELDAAVAEREDAELAWLETSETLEG
jgi:ATP-binding cassette subfamily F protein uup